MIILFFFILLIGLGAFVFVFMKGLKGVASAKVSFKEPLPSEPLPVLSVDIPATVSEINLLKDLHQQTLQKVVKQEEMLEEKNKIITALQEGAHTSHDQQGQIESITQIFQSQIEELKGQNKKLKDELSRLIDENMDLQTRVYAAQPAKVLAEPQPPTVQEIVPKPASSQSGLSLHDVFGDEG